MKKSPTYLRDKQERFTCPCCNKTVGQEHVSKALATRLPDWGYYYKITIDDLKRPTVRWACDTCLSKRKAIPGNPTKQMYGFDPPYLAYFDREGTCRSCSKTFVFSATQQQRWYEVLRFWVKSVPVRCSSCRKAIRHSNNLNTQLSELLKNGEPEDAETLQRIAALYHATDNPAKAKIFERKAAKRIKKG